MKCASLVNYTTVIFFLVSLFYSWWRFLEINECCNKLTFISGIAWFKKFTHSAIKVYIFVLAGLYLNLSSTEGYIILDYQQETDTMFLWYPQCLTSNKASKRKIFLCEMAEGKKIVSDRRFKDPKYKLNRLTPLCWKLDILIAP